MTDIITLNCLVYGDSPSHNIFSVEISRNGNIIQLKKLIKAEKPNDLANIDADKLALWKVDIPSDRLATLATADIDVIMEGPKLLSVEKINRVFSNEPADECLHIVVNCPANPMSLPQNSGKY